MIINILYLTMINPPHVGHSSSVSNKPLSDFNTSLKVGQIINARTESGGDTNSKVILRAGKFLLESRTPIPLQTGEQIKLIVKQAGDSPVFNILKEQANTRLTAQTIQHHLRNYISRQADIRPLLESAKSHANNPLLSNNVRQQIQSLINNIPDLEQVINARQLKTLIKNNSIFLESSLQGGSNQEVNHNLKAQILKLRALIAQDQNLLPAQNKQSPGELLNLLAKFNNSGINFQQLINLSARVLPVTQLNQLIHILSGQTNKIPFSDYTHGLNQLLSIIKKQANSDGLEKSIRVLLEKALLLQELKTAISESLSRIGAHQLIPLVRDSEHPLLLLFDLIFKHNNHFNIVEFEIEKDRQHSDDNENTWSVIIRFDISDLGPVKTKITLTDKRISVVFHAKLSNTKQKIQQHLPLLESALVTAGFELSHIQVFQQTQDASPRMPSDIALVDEKV